MDFAAADSALPANKGLRQKYTLPAAHKVFSSAAGLLANVTRAGLTAARQILHNRFTIKKIAAAHVYIALQPYFIEILQTVSAAGSLLGPAADAACRRGQPVGCPEALV